ncbi:MAG: iron-containing alcohol dehydrogenase [Lachnospiraceae bacterium]|nr:iron-containing alcohol dehydrogenase [Lachnospiraceae bacterium]
MNNFIYEIPTKVYFGEKQLQKNLSEEVKKCGSKVLLVYGGGSIKKNGLYQEIMEELEDPEIEVYEFSGIEPNPRHTAVNEAVAICKEKDIDVILAVGGGSVIDSCKATAAGKYYDGDIWDFAEKKAEIKKALPIIAILTLASTGSEMYTNSVISNLDLHEKKGIKSTLLRPKVSFLDPTLTYSVNQYQTACGSFDILSHIMETYFAREDGLHMLDTIMEGLMRTVIKYAPIAYHEPDNYEARANLMWASSWALNGFVRIDKQPNTWACHPIEHELSAFYDITHGLGLAILTPRYLRYALSEDTVDRYYQFGVNVWNIDANLPKMEVAEKSIECLEKLFYQDLKLTDHLTDLNINEEHFEEMADRVCVNGVVKSFIDLDKGDVVKILKECL